MVAQLLDEHISLNHVRQAAGAALPPGTAVLSRRLHGVRESDLVAAPPLLQPQTELAECWLVPQASVHHGRHGCISYSTDGRWLHGTALVEERDTPGGLQAATRRAYTDLFEVLEASGCGHLLRLWNYIADINVPSGGLERYRQFNIGRQEAFLAARRSVYAGAPAACALGTERGPLTVHFLSGKMPALAVENPRQVSAYHYPDAYGPRSPTFSRGALVDIAGTHEALFISGTASIVGHATVHTGDVRRQTEETLANIEAVLAAAAPGSRATSAHDLQSLEYTVYVRHEADLPVVQQVFERKVGAGSAAARRALYMRADVCRADLLVEVEAQSILAASKELSA